MLDAVERGEGNGGGRSAGKEPLPSKPGNKTVKKNQKTKKLLRKSKNKKYS